MPRSTLFATLLLALSACSGPSGGGPAPTPPGQEAPAPSPVGTPTAAPIQTVIGAAGGTLSTPDGAVRLDIPAGALSADQTLGLQPITRTAPGGTGQTYRLSPEGLTFATPARLTFTYIDEDIQGSAPEALSIGFQDKQGVWQYVRKPTRDLAAKTVSVETSHFSDWSMLEGVQLRPLQAEVEVGKTLQLQVLSCVPLDADDEDELLPSSMCAATTAASTARGWAANGLAGGNASVGTVADLGNSEGKAIYSAPARTPARNPVAVSVNVLTKSLGNVTLVSNVQVREPGKTWQGQVFYTETGTRPWKMRDGFESTGTEFAKLTQTYKVVGVKSEDAYDTVLLLEHQGTAEYSDIGHMEKKIYEICEAFGPTILRHHFIYDRNFRMSGTVKTTLEARLNIVNGRYSLAISPQDVPLTGQDRTIEIHKDGCAGTTDDRSNSKPAKSVDGPATLNIAGPLDPARPDTLKGQYEGRSEVFIQPTHSLVSWELTRAP